MPAFMDLTGQRFGRLLVIRRGPNTGRTTRWRCQCDCGRTSMPAAQDLRNGRTVSCGCWRVEQSYIGHPIHGGTSGGVLKPEYISYRAMKARCYLPQDISYKNYGARGIRVCERWLNGEGGLSGIECFFRDMGERPSKSHSLDRIDSNADYSPQNCRWATATEQMRNRRNTRRVVVNGEARALADVCDGAKVSVATVADRLKKGWTLDQAINTPRHGAAA